jgi:hypothetical protein
MIPKRGSEYCDKADRPDQKGRLSTDDSFPLSRDKARDMRPHLAAHAGEAAGPESAWGSPTCLGAEHVGCGLAARFSPELWDIF